MIRLVMLFMCLVSLITSCSNKQSKENINIVKNKVIQQNDQENEDLQLFRQTCYACHSVTAKSHDELIAPPMMAVKRRYLRSYPAREDFIRAVVAYASDPKEENALMIGAVEQFNAMPKQNFEIDNLKRIAAYIYDHEIEKPAWFESHFQEEHPNGMMGRGNGQGRRGMKN